MKIENKQKMSVPPPFNASSSSSYTYRVDLWDKFVEIINKLVTNKADVKQFQALVKETASLFETIGKKLSKTKLTTETDS